MLVRITSNWVVNKCNICSLFTLDLSSLRELLTKLLANIKTGFF